MTLVEKTLHLHRELKEEAEKEGVESEKHEQYKSDISSTDRRIDALVKSQIYPVLSFRA
ncbi:MAG: hypothetical protein NTV58_19380 [Deltaproteobacteria bacterium]|nr:hypothetical protein [Deltaproteobacteria bacterium]